MAKDRLLAALAASFALAERAALHWASARFDRARCVPQAVLSHHRAVAAAHLCWSAAQISVGPWSAVEEMLFSPEACLATNASRELAGLRSCLALQLKLRKLCGLDLLRVEMHQR